HISRQGAEAAEQHGPWQDSAVTSDSDAAELSSLRTLIEDATHRIVAVADQYREGPDSGVATELDQAERNLITAARAVGRAVSLLRRP
ncbi:MAG: hypothetical protein ACOYNI_12710, partial [Acidimicrobiia bacterium]